jgi:hypothetical protein
MAEFVFSKRYSESLSRQTVLPSRLYKYRSLRDGAKAFSRTLLTRSEVYFAKPDELNDPYDCRPHNTIKSTDAERRAFWTSVTKGREPQLSRATRRARVAAITAAMRDRIRNEGFEAVAQAAYDQNLGETGVLSLSAEPASNLMWSHYADAHRGICIEFDFALLRVICPLPVTYSDERPSFNMIKDITALTECAFLRKSAEWSYEQEWRAAGLWWSGSFKLPNKAITGVILGAGISAEDRNEVLHWALGDEDPIQVRQARFPSNSYRLSFDAAAGYAALGDELGDMGQSTPKRHETVADRRYKGR